MTNNVVKLCALVACFLFSHVQAQNDEKNAIIVSKLYEIQDSIQQDLSHQVGLELQASIQYLAMASFFGQDDVSLSGFKKFFMENSDEERDHAKKLVEYLNERDGKLQALDIKMPISYKGSSGLQALKDALVLEKEVTKHLVKLHGKASSDQHRDIHLVDMLESDFLREQVESTRVLQGMISRLSKMSTAGNVHLAEYLFDLELQGKKD